MLLVDEKLNRFCQELLLYRSIIDDEAVMKSKLMKTHGISKAEIDKWIKVGDYHNAENVERRKFVISFTHYSGENRSKIDSKQLWKVYLKADGFGKRSAAELRRLNGGWDWSHIRDSTINGFIEMERQLKKYGFNKFDV